MALTRTSFRGVTLNLRTIEMIEAAEEILGFKLRLTQGSYNKGGVTASAGTHDGGGVVDVSLKDAKTGELFPEVRRNRIRDAMRQVGFAAWIRNPSQSNPPWPWHCHAVAVGDKELSSGAAQQVVAYHNGKNGLASNGKDDGPRTWAGSGYTYEVYRQTHPKEPFTMGQYENLQAAITKLTNAVTAMTATIAAEGELTRKEVRRQAIWSLRYEGQTDDDRIKADKAFDVAYDAAKASGKSHDDALIEGVKAANSTMQPILDDLAKRAQQNG